ncbi:Arm DNA-binding domain-containing protein [Puia sp. P3]|uniref:Arm DNA-binding domain-containing protein n=1 Tax=Puia sp. P3 TaxID=3423952 RepID=UPI003D67EB07
MKSNNTFGVHFVLRTSRTSDDDKFPVYARIVVNGTRTEFSMKHSISKADWNFGKGQAKPKIPNSELSTVICRKCRESSTATTGTYNWKTSP